MSRLISRTSVVGRLLATLYPEGVQPGHVALLPRQMALLDLVAESAAVGKAVSVPLHLMGEFDGDGPAFEAAPAPAPVTAPLPEVFEDDLEDEPIAYVPAKPVTTPKSVDWDDMPLGIISDALSGKVAGVGAESARVARIKRKKKLASVTRGKASVMVSARALVAAWGVERVRAWMDRWPRARQAFGAELDAAIQMADEPPSPIRKRPAKWASPPVTVKVDVAEVDTPPPPPTTARRQQKPRTAVTLSGRLTKEELAAGGELIDADTWTGRPKTRADCVNGPRPCPWVSCRHHLALDTSATGDGRGSITLTYGHDDLEQMPETCSLDVADKGGITLEEVAKVLPMSRERVRQIEAAALERAKKHVPGEPLDWFGDEGEVSP